MQSTLSIQPPYPKKGVPLAGSSPHFGGGLKDRVLDGYEWISATRAREMIWEDMAGNGVLRTGSDTLRGLLFGTGHLNWILGRERISREASSIFTDNMSAGLMAVGLGVLVDRWLGTVTNSHVNLSSLELVRDQASPNAHWSEMVAGIGKTVAHQNPQADRDIIESVFQPESLASLLDKTPQGKPKLLSDKVQSLSARLAHALQGQDLSLTLEQGLGKAKSQVTHAIPTLLEDLALLGHHVGQATPAQLPAILEKTQRWKIARIGLLTGSFALTSLVPHVNKWLTRKWYGVDSYPGDEGLAKAPQTFLYRQGYAGTGTDQQALKQPHPMRRATPLERFFPYLSEKWHQGNPWPLVGSILPLVMATGLFRTESRRFVLPALKNFEWRLPKGLLASASEKVAASPVVVQGQTPRQWLKSWLTSMDYERGFPWTTQQQMAMLYAALITSRIASARSVNEYRERAVDGSLGWGLWILGSPLIRPQLAKRLFNGEAFQLLKPDGALRSAAEIKTFSADDLAKAGKTVPQALRQLSAVQAAAFGLNVLLLGIVEPFISMSTTLLFNRRASVPPPVDLAPWMDRPYQALPAMQAQGVTTIQPGQHFARRF